MGKICSGKSYVANYLVNNYNFTKYSFAAPLKKIAIEYYNMKNKDRELLQDLSYKMKEIDENVFVNYLLKEIDLTKNIVIDDLRFTNELRALKELNFTIIKLEIDKEEQLNRYNNIYNNEYIERLNHFSENQIEYNKENIDYNIKSDKNLIKNIIKLINL